MTSNSFGSLFTITTFGESHGPGIGVVIDGCPAGLSLCKEDLSLDLFRRRPGRTLWTSPRNESDEVEILSGLFEGKTTGTPLTFWIPNRDSEPAPYEEVKRVLRPGHAQWSYLMKYGVFDYRGGGRASARETVARVAAGSVAKKLLSQLHQTTITGFLSQVGPLQIPPLDFECLEEKTKTSPIFCPHEETEKEIQQLLKTIQIEGDSLGGVVGCWVEQVPPGLGDPIYRKIEALLAFAMLSLPASKGFEMGTGFRAAEMKGSQHNDRWISLPNGKIQTQENRAGGVLGGITTGEPLYFQVAFKPPSGIRKPQPSVDLDGNETLFQLSPQGRHDPCVAIRAVPVVEAMCALVLVDLLLAQQTSKITSLQ